MCYRTDPGGGGMIYYYRMDPPLCSRGPPNHTRFSLPATRERRLSMPEIGEKERDYLLKEIYKLKSKDLMSSLRSQSPLEYPQTCSPPFPLCPVQGTLSQKKKQTSMGLLCPSHVVPERHCMAAVPGFKSQCQSSSAIPFLTPPTTGHSCQHSLFFQLYSAAIVSQDRCDPVVWSQSSPSSYTGAVTRGSCLPVTSWVEVTPIPLAQSKATAV